jgi:preprotein translocase subunit SecE
MSSQAETSNPMNIVWWVVTIALVSAGVAGNMYYGDQSLLYRVLGLVVLGAVAIFVVLKTEQGAAFATLLKDARIEVRKVVWPTHQETTQTSLLVLALVLIAALILWGLDSVLGLIVSSIIG